MREPPGLRTDTVIGTLYRSFGIEVGRLTFLPIGEDSSSYAYQVEAAGGSSYFLKVRAGADDAPGATVPTYLHRRGVAHVLAPLASNAGASFVPLGTFALMLYPMLDAPPGAEVGLSPHHWREFGTTVRQLHTVPVTAELDRLVGRETFRPVRRELIEDLERVVVNGFRDDPAARELSDFWRARRSVIHGLIAQADELGSALEQRPFTPVLCHGDLHTWNVLVGADGQLWLVDWDEAVLAPKERDLMFAIGGISRDLVRPQDTELFLEGYGDTTIDEHLLVYYRCAWAVQDIAAYAEQVFLMPTLTGATRRAATGGFIDLFEPGNIVELATSRKGV